MYTKKMPPGAATSNVIHRNVKVADANSCREQLVLLPELGGLANDSPESLGLSRCLLFAWHSEQQRDEVFVKFVREQPVTKCRSVIVPFGKDQ